MLKPLHVRCGVHCDAGWRALARSRVPGAESDWANLVGRGGGTPSCLLRLSGSLTSFTWTPV